jgi:uncharacterized membrane protein
MAFVMVQFSAIAYSPRLVLWFARDHALFHALGLFSATFLYALFTVAWIDRSGSGTVPLFSTMIVGVMHLHVTNVLHLVGDKGREVIRQTFRRLDDEPTAAQTIRQDGGAAQLGPVTQTLKYAGDPRTITRLDIAALVQEAKKVDGVIVMDCAVGDTLTEDTLLLRVHGAASPVSEHRVLRAIHIDRERTFEQDPKYPIRLLVDIAIRALSPAVNDPTTAVQTIDQIEDLLRRLGRRELDAGYADDANGVLRLVYPMPTWPDYLALAFDEIRQYGAGSVQVMRRLRSALIALLESASAEDRAHAVRRYLEHLDLAIERSPLDTRDRVAARQEDRQGLGLSHRPVELTKPEPPAREAIEELGVAQS